MKRRSFITGLLLASFGALLCASAPRPVRASNEVTLVLITAPKSKLENISLTDLRRVFTSERLPDPEGQTLLPLNYPPRSPERTVFDRVVLRLKPDGVIRFWIDRRIRGGKGPPRVVESPAVVRRAVASLPGAIAYVPIASLTNEVKVVRVEGKLPKDADYPLRGEPQ